VAIAHPASILRMNETVQGMNIQRCVIQIRNAIEGVSS
jgi:hypothetical protein